MSIGWTVYILQCADGTLYTGITNDLDNRLARHNDGAGAKYTRGRGPHTLLFSETHPDRSSASKKEAAIKAMSREDKLDLSLSRRERATEG